MSRPGPILKDITPADLATLLNAGLGLAAVALAAAGRPVLAAALVLLGILADGLDGALARLGHGGGPLGATLDTLADAVTFGVAPAAVLMSWTPYDPLVAAAALLFLVAVLLRLARFHALPDAGHFWGLSSPGGAMLVLLVLLADLHAWAGPGAVLVAAAFMLARRPLPKLRGWLGIVGVVVIAAVLAGHGASWQPMAATFAVGLLLVYILLGPGHVRARANQPLPEAS